MRGARPVQYGDFQTPDALASRVCRLLVRAGESPDSVVEPTVGRGAFLVAASQAFPRATLHGADIHPPHVAEATARLSQCGAAGRSHVVARDFFSTDWSKQLERQNGRLLVLGNPPWVTAAAISAEGGDNLPEKSNFLGLRGLAARTGKANFDIAESMIIRLLQALGRRPATVAMLCKTMTARKVLRYAWRHELPIARASIHGIDAVADFGASVEACLLFLRTGTAGAAEAEVFTDLETANPNSRMGIVGRDLVPDIDTYRRMQHLEGTSPFRWRSGVKHDCASVMELRSSGDGAWANGLGETVSIEPGLVFPLLKCTDLARDRLSTDRWVLVTQRRPNDDTERIACDAPKAWAYLQKHADRFAARKSSIYKKGARFAMFGIGDYSFAPWKVAVSGLHASPSFRVVGPREGRPVLFDDTCYFLSFDQEGLSRLVADVLNSEPCRRFLLSQVFPGTKRPFTVDLLHRLNFSRLAEEAGLTERWLELFAAHAGTNAQTEFVMDGR